MSATVPPHPSQALMARETRLERGSVPVALDGHPVPPGQHRLAGDAFLLHADSGARFLYRRGQGKVVMDAAPDADPAELSLWHNGSVYAAVAALNGLRPIHASAIAIKGRAVAFTAPAGGGKSTMAAMLARRGYPLFADDTLVLDLADPGRPVCLPGHKRLKLTEPSLALTGFPRQEQVAPDYHKFYALPPAGDQPRALPLAALVFLEFAEEPSLARIGGAERFARLQDQHDTDAFWRAAQGHDHARLFAAQAGLAGAIEMWRLVRRNDLSEFDTSLAMAETVIAEATGAAA